MKIEIRLTSSLYEQIIRDLARRHPFAAERVGFVTGRLGSLENDGKLILLTNYHSIPDDQYVKDRSVGARIGPDAMNWAMQAAYRGRPEREGVFHIHLHEHRGVTGMSAVDRREIPQLIPGFQSVGKDAAHGIIILSEDHGSGWVWLPSSKTPVLAGSISVLGPPVRVFEQVSGDRPRRSKLQLVFDGIANLGRRIRSLFAR